MISSGLASLRSAMCEVRPAPPLVPATTLRARALLGPTKTCGAAAQGMVMDELVARAKIVEPTGENCDIRIAGTVFLQVTPLPPFFLLPLAWLCLFLARIYSVRTRRVRQVLYSICLKEIYMYICVCMYIHIHL